MTSGRFAPLVEVRARRVDLLPRGGDRGGDPAVGVGERRRGWRRPARARRSAPRRFVSPAARSRRELVDRVLEQHRLCDRLLGGADADRGLAAVAGADGGLRRRRAARRRRRCAARACSGLSATVARASGAYADCERRADARQRRRCDAAASAARLVHARERLGCVLLELAQLVERRGLLVEPRVRLLAQRDDARVPGARLLLGVGCRVVELLLEREGLREVLLRVGERLLELDGRGIAELRLREAELLGAGLDRVVGLDERGGRAPRELLGGDLLDRRTAAGGADRPLLAAAADDEPDDDADGRQRRRGR